MTRVLFLIVSILLIGLPQTSLAAREVRNYDRDLHKVQTCIKNGEFAAAEALIRKMLVSFPANPELLSIQARLCFWEKDYEQSIETYHKLLGKTPTPALREELEKVLVARELCDIDGLLKSEKTGEAENRLEKLYLSSGGEYEVAYRLGTLSLENREYGRALQVFAELRRRYPRDANTEALYIKALLFRGSQSGLASQKQEDFSTAEKLLAAQLAIQPDNPDLLFLQARFFFWEKRYDESIATYRKLLSLQPSAEAETGLQQVTVAKELSDIDRLLQSNELKAARGLLETLYKAGAPFEAGHRLGLLYLRQGDYAGSLRVMGELRKQYPDDPGIEAPYIEALYFSGDVSAALAAVKDGLVRNGEAAQERLEKLYRSGTAPYEAGYRLGALCLRERNYDRALQVYGELHSLYPADKGFEALRIESLMVTGNVGKAREALAALPATGREELYGEREELFYRVRPDYLLVKGEYDSFSRGFQDGNEFLVELSRRAGQVTLVPRYTHVSRFGLHNNQLGLDISSKVAEKSSIWGYLSLSYSPDAVFLPEWTAGATVYKGYRGYEFFAGYTRMSFPHADADIVNSGAIAYLPAGFALEGRLYLVPRQGSVTGAARVIYEPGHKVKAFYSLAVGQSAEKIIEQQDFRKLFTVTQRGGIEYRFRPSVGVGAELYYSYREHLYSTTGASLFTRYWW